LAFSVSDVSLLPAARHGSELHTGTSVKLYCYGVKITPATKR